MTERKDRSANGENDTKDASQSPPTIPTRLGRRIATGSILTQIFGEGGATELKERNWTVAGGILVAMGVVADMFEIFGRVTLTCLIASAAAMFIFGLIVFFRLRGRKQCILPLAFTFLMVIVFAGFFVVQETANAGETGWIAKIFPGASKVQIAFVNKLEEIFPEASDIQIAIKAEQHELKVGQDELKSKLENMIRQFEQANPEADPATLEAFRMAAESLAASGDARKRKALEDYAEGKVDRAVTDLTRLAEDQARTAGINMAQAAETWKEIGALAFVTDTEKALHAYRQAAVLLPDDPVVRLRIGGLLQKVGDMDGARTEFEVVLGLNRPGATDLKSTALALNYIGEIEYTRGNLDAAKSYYKSGLSLFEELDSKVGMAVILTNIGSIEILRSNLDAAEVYYKRSLALHEGQKNKAGIAHNFLALGKVEVSRGNLDTAEEYFKSSFDLFEKMGRNDGMALAIGNLGVIEYSRRNLDVAEAYYKRGYALNEELGYKSGMAGNLSNLGLIEILRSNLDAAEVYYKRSLALYEELGGMEGTARTLYNLGQLETSRSNLDTAEAYYERGMALNEELGNKEGIADVLANRGLVERLRDNFEVACTHWSKSEALFKEIGAQRSMKGVQALLDANCKGRL
ncbi:tetratricopeptide repeat protein [Gammaproteobacteria bacterium]|nr:tetratricopeptide repeat protein [Gammaproteobacteria bacterium]